jgi:hypothetical protein
MPKLPKIAEIAFFQPSRVHNGSSIWILWRLSILAIVLAAILVAAR